MNLIGKWQIAELLQFDDEKGMIWTKASDLLTSEDVDKDMQMMAKTVALFEENGELFLLSPIPEGVSQQEIDEAVAAGEIQLRDGQMITGQHHWKVENGKNMTDTGMEGEVLGEKVGPWEEVKEIDEHTVEIMMFRFQRAD